MMKRGTIDQLNKQRQDLFRSGEDTLVAFGLAFVEGRRDSRLERIRQLDAYEEIRGASDLPGREMQKQTYLWELEILDSLIERSSERPFVEVARERLQQLNGSAHGGWPTTYQADRDRYWFREAERDLLLQMLIDWKRLARSMAEAVA